MTLKIEQVAGPYKGACGGLAWDGKAMLFSLIDEERILKFDPSRRSGDEVRRYTLRTNGIGLGPDGTLFGCQEGGRRIIRFMPDGSARTSLNKLGGRIHNHPSDLVVDRTGRVWFTDPFNPVPAIGPQITPPLDHASVLRLEKDHVRNWRLVRVTLDTKAPRAVLLSADDTTLFVADGNASDPEPREFRAYPVREDGSVGACTVLHTFGRDHRGPHRGIEGMCLESNGNVVACAGWKRSGAGPMIYVFSPSGAVQECVPLPFDLPAKCAFGDAALDSLYVTTLEGKVYRIEGSGLKGHPARSFVGKT